LPDFNQVRRRLTAAAPGRPDTLKAADAKALTRPEAPTS
jgi:hypothetical protein